jgi:hypothetical protein
MHMPTILTLPNREYGRDHYSRCGKIQLTLRQQPDEANHGKYWHHGFTCFMNLLAASRRVSVLTAGFSVLFIAARLPQ